METTYLTLKRMAAQGCSHSDILLSGMRSPLHQGYDLAEGLLVIYFLEGIIIVSPFNNVRKYYAVE